MESLTNQVDVVLYFVVFALGLVIGIVVRGSREGIAPRQYAHTHAYQPHAPPQHGQPAAAPTTYHQPQVAPGGCVAAPHHNGGDESLAPTAYKALAELAGCNGVVVVEHGRVLCIEGEEARVVWGGRGG